MDYQGAINALRLGRGLEIAGDPRRAAEFLEGLDAAISAMKELQEYKQLGALEDLKKLKERELSGVELAKIACNLNQLEKYKQLGTLEEVREALEKQKAKKPGEVTNGLIWWDNDGNPVWLTDHICAVCGKRIIPEYRHCPYCGQAIDWSEVEE